MAPLFENPRRTSADATFASSHTSNLPALLHGHGIALLLSASHANSLILVRADGDTLNTHYLPADRPMGLACDGARLAVGTRLGVSEYANVPAAAGKVAPRGRHDACYVPRHHRVTGDVDGHELAFAGDGELWLVNTLFSCLCTLDPAVSFVPRWRPPFVSALAAEDRCHLNGLALRDGRPAYATALGTADTREGWRERRGDGGVLIDIADGRIVAEGLCLPHSPRWHGGRLFCLESGTGSLGAVDPANGRRETLCTLPGYTRGLALHGDLAFVGVSQLRDDAVFEGMPLAAGDEPLHCGVWAVDLARGEIAGFLRFDGAVRELFAVAALPQTRFPAVLENEDPLVGTTWVLPDAALAEVARDG